MQGEQYDIMVTWGHLYLQMNMPAIKPPWRVLCRTSTCSGAWPRRWASTDDYWDHERRRVADESLRLERAGARRASRSTSSRRTAGSASTSACRTSARRMPKATSRRRRASASSPRAWRPAATWCSTSGARVTTGMQVGGYVDPVPNLHPAARRPTRRRGETCDRRPFPAEHALAEAARVPQHAIWQREDAAGAPRRAAHHDQPGRCGEPDPLPTASYVRVFNDRGTFEALAVISDDVGSRPYG